MHKNELKSHLLGAAIEAGRCLVEFDADGKFNTFDSDAESFFGCPAAEAIGKIHYRQFHDDEQLQGCHDDDDFARSIEERGMSEGLWTIGPRAGDPFCAHVSLYALDEADENRPMKIAEVHGWLAHYEKQPSAKQSGLE